MNNNDKLFIGAEIVKAAQNQVTVLLPHIHSRNRCAGLFSDNPLEMTVTTKHAQAEFLRTFLHESCHMDQFLEQAEVWNDPAIRGRSDAFDEYLLGIRKKKNRTVTEYAKGSLRLELDCEIRAVDKIIKYSLSIDLDDYIRRASVYLYAWPELLGSRRWYDDYKKPYDDKDILAAMPTRLLKFGDYWKGHPMVREFLSRHNKILY